MFMMSMTFIPDIKPEVRLLFVEYSDGCLEFTSILLYSWHTRDILFHGGRKRNLEFPPQLIVFYMASTFATDDGSTKMVPSS